MARRDVKFADALVKGLASLAAVSVLGALSLVAGCGSKEPEAASPAHPLQAQFDQERQAKPIALPTASGEDRVTVTRIQVIKDSIAYGRERGVYIIRDNETGQEYLGVSGIGITERGSHRVGKRRSEDER